ncbi:hypothetical protein LSTR_LSTR000074 [Laodelphax striatellus]|uniref:TIMELESS-interacting protein n=1 Tax=Laodelphax striatellus TaxID=195883 RepID=A0A482X7H0_LAOST|nr:hypothetical protein LSTR_LSTR000074 [Laodelphax striatellus]
MALLEHDLFSNEIVDDPEDLDLLVDGRGQEDNGITEQPTGDNSDKDEKKEDDKPEKKKRKQSQRPRFNILRLKDNDIGLIAAERMFKGVKFRGKGHELDDLNLIMKKMEIWAHKLYPSFDFDDCLAKLEKLGNTREVATYVKKLRMGLEDDIVAPQHDDADEDNENTNEVDTGEIQDPPRADSPGRFDQLIRNQPQHEPTQGGLTEEQRERMRRNRLIAEQRRMARLKALHEKQESTASSQPENNTNELPFDMGQTSGNSHSPENNTSELQNTSNNECPDVEPTKSQNEKDLSLIINTQDDSVTKNNDGNSDTCMESEEATHDVSSTNKVSPVLTTNVPENSYDFFEPMDDIDMAELP